MYQECHKQFCPWGLQRGVENMKRIIILMVLSAVFSLGCDDARKPITGTWVGKTSQGFGMTVKVEPVGGSPTVTELKYDITKSGAYYSSTTTMNLPTKLSVKIIDNKFSHSGSDYKVSGTFEDNALKGNLSATSVHPQPGYGTATGDVTFVLNKNDADK
jgi:hypothetical protein